MAVAGVIPVFRPTLAEMADFPAYISFMESQGAHNIGLAKVIPPPDYVARFDYSDVNVRVTQPIRQEIAGRNGLYQVVNLVARSKTYEEFKAMALSEKYAPPDHKGDWDLLERKFWKNLTFNSAIYGADVSGSVFAPDSQIWNINSLGTILDLIGGESNVKIEGVNTAYLYFGMWKAAFCWHTEDMDLYSINYIHFGSPKTWYCVPPAHADRFERLAKEFFADSFASCSQFLRHKMFLISPSVLHDYSIPCYKTVHEAGEFMITFPRAYHAGFNHGFNLAESTNFASDRWIEYGMNAMVCECRPESVRIAMRPFLERFRPEQYQLLLAEERMEQEAEQAKAEAQQAAQQAALSRIDTLSFRADAGGSPVDAPRKRRRIDHGTPRSPGAAQSVAAAAWAKELALNQTLAGAQVLDDRMLLACNVCYSRGEPLSNDGPACCTANGTALQFDVPALPTAAEHHAGSEAGDAQEFWESKTSPAGGASEPHLQEKWLLAPEDLVKMVVCQRCAVAVHVGCYGVTQRPRPPGWLCDRCAQQLPVVPCVLCPNAGGAFKPTGDGRWVHVSCALWTPEVSFDNAITMTRVVGLETIAKDRWKLACKFCRDRQSKRPRGAPIQCQKGACISAFHTTCAQRNGLNISIVVDSQTGGTVCSAYCQRHDPAQKMTTAAYAPEVGDHVLAKWSASQFFPGHVVGICPVYACRVRFEDSSVAEEVPQRYVFKKSLPSWPRPEGGQVHTPIASPPPSRPSTPENERDGLQHQHLQVGQAVEVLWVDERTYGGVFLGYVELMRYQVAFDDGYSTKVRAQDIKPWAPDPQPPLHESALQQQQQQRLDFDAQVLESKRSRPQHDYARMARNMVIVE